MLTLNFSPFPNLKTGRLILRRLINEDDKEIFSLRSDEDVNRYLDRAKATSLDDARNHIKKLDNGINNNESILWGITLLDTPAIIGTICLWNIEKDKDTAEVGFELMPDFQGKGIMKEAFAAIAGFGFETLKLKRLTAWVHHDNGRSISLLCKFNFKRDPTEEEKIDKTELGNVAIYTLDATAYY